jgi:ATP-dependent DNA helicase RecQ
VAFYHSDVATQEKENVHNSWLNDDIKIIVATTAFGMGIDKPGIF